MARHRGRPYWRPVSLALFRVLFRCRRYYLARMHRNHFTSSTTQYSIKWYTILESCVMVGMTIAQVYYVRHVINSRSWV